MSFTNNCSNRFLMYTLSYLIYFFLLSIQNLSQNEVEAQVLYYPDNFSTSPSPNNITIDSLVCDQLIVVNVAESTTFTIKNSTIFSVIFGLATNSNDHSKYITFTNVSIVVKDSSFYRVRFSPLKIYNSTEILFNNCVFWGKIPSSDVVPSLVFDVGSQGSIVTFFGILSYSPLFNLKFTNNRFSKTLNFPDSSETSWEKSLLKIIVGTSQLFARSNASSSSVIPNYFDPPESQFFVLDTLLIFNNTFESLFVTSAMAHVLFLDVVKMNTLNISNNAITGPVFSNPGTDSQRKLIFVEVQNRGVLTIDDLHFVEAQETVSSSSSKIILNQFQDVAINYNTLKLFLTADDQGRLLGNVRFTSLIELQNWCARIFNGLTISNNFFDAPQGTTPVWPYGRIEVEMKAVGINVVGNFLQGAIKSSSSSSSSTAIKAAIVNLSNNVGTLNAPFGVILVEFSLGEINKISSIFANNNSLVSTFAHGVETVEIQASNLTNCDHVFICNNSLHFVQSPFHPEAQNRSTSGVTARFNDLRKTLHGDPLIFVGAFNVLLVQLNHNKLYTRNAGGGAAASTTAVFNRTKKIELQYNVADLVILSNIVTPPTLDLGDKVNNYIGCARVGDTYDTVEEVVIDNNAVNVTYQWNSGFGPIRFFANQNSTNIGSVLLRNNTVSIFKTETGYAQDRTGNALDFAVYVARLENVGYVEISSNHLTFQTIERGKCPISGCQGIFLSLTGEKIRNIQLINITNNFVNVDATVGGLGSAGLGLLVSNGDIPVIEIEKQRAIVSGGNVSNLKSLLVTSNVFHVKDPFTGSPICLSIAGIYTGEEIRIINNTFFMNNNNNNNNNQQKISCSYGCTGGVQISCPFSLIQVSTTAIFTSECTQSVMQLANFEISNIAVNGNGNDFLYVETAVTVRNEWKFRNISFVSDASSIPITVLNFIAQISGIFANFDNRWSSFTPKLTFDQINSSIKTLCSPTTDQTLDVLRRVVPSARVGAIRLPMLSTPSSSNNNKNNNGNTILSIYSSSFSTTCLDATLTSHRQVSSIFLGNGVQNLNVTAINSSFQFLPSSTSISPSESLRVDHISADFSSDSASSTSPPLTILKLTSSNVKVLTSGSVLDSFISSSDNSIPSDALSSFPRLQSTILNSTMKCLEWNTQKIISMKDNIIRSSLLVLAASSSSASTQQQGGGKVTSNIKACNGALLSETISRSLHEITNTDNGTRSIERSDSTSLTNLVPPTDLGLAASVVTQLETAAKVSTAIATLVADNPSAFLTTIRGTAMMRLAMCKMAGVKEFNVPNHEAFFTNYSTAKLKEQLSFPDILIQSFNVGNEIGSSFRASIVLYIVFVAALVLVTLYLATLNKTKWRMLVFEADALEKRERSGNRSSSKPITRDEEDGEIGSTTSRVSSPKFRLHSHNDENGHDGETKDSPLNGSEDDELSSSTTARGHAQSELVIQASRQHQQYLKQRQIQLLKDEEARVKKEQEREQKEQDKLRGKPKTTKFGASGIFVSSAANKKMKKIRNQDLLSSLVNQDDEQGENFSASRNLEEQQLTEQEQAVLEKAKEQQKRIEAAKKSKITFSAAAQAVSDMSIFSFWSIDSILLKILVIIIPFWSSVAGGLASVAPSGVGDYVLAILPIFVIGVFVVGCAVYIWRMISSCPGTAAVRAGFEDPLLTKEKMILKSTRSTSLATRKKTMKEKRQQEEEESMTPAMRKRAMKKKQKEQELLQEQLLAAEAEIQRQQRFEMLKKAQVEWKRQDRIKAGEEDSDEDDGDDSNNYHRSRRGGRRSSDASSNTTASTNTKSTVRHQQKKSKNSATFHDDDEGENPAVDDANSSHCSPSQNNQKKSPSPSGRSMANIHIHNPDPLYFVEKSEIYFPLGSSSPFQQFLHRLIQHRISRFLFVGDHTWFNPYLILEGNLGVVHGPGIFTQFPYTFSVFNGPHKRPLKANAATAMKGKSDDREEEDEVTTSTMSNKNKKFTPSIIANSRSSRNIKGNDNDDSGEELGSVRSFKTNKTNNNSVSSPSKPKFSNFRHDSGDERVIFESTLRLRLSPLWVFFSLIATLVCSSFVGASHINPQNCYGAFLVSYFLTSLPVFVGSVILRPYLVPARNLVLVVLEFSIALGGTLFFAVLVAGTSSSSSADSNVNAISRMKATIVAAQILTMLPSVILGNAMTVVGVVRVLIMLVGRSKVVTLTQLRNHLPKELDAAEAGILKKVKNAAEVASSQVEENKGRTKLFSGIDGSWFFDD